MPQPASTAIPSAAAPSTAVRQAAPAGAVVAGATVAAPGPAGGIPVGLAGLTATATARPAPWSLGPIVPGTATWDLLGAALDLDLRTGAPVHEAHTLTTLVVHRRRAGAARGRDLGGTEELARRARELAVPLGLVGPLRHLGGRPGQVPLQRSDGLTAREADVLGLLGEGLSNREIGETLQLSINSVKTYIRSAYRKMGVERRTQAVLWGLDNGLDSRLSSLVG